MRRIIFLALIFGFSSCQDLKCVDAKFQYCQFILSQQIGLNETISSQMFKDYSILYDYFLFMFGKQPGTVADMLTVCNGLETFNLCMHGNRGCLDISNLIKKTDINNAYGVEATYRQYTIFNCGPGINTLLYEDLVCAQRVLKNQQNVLKTCVKTYELNVANDAKNGCSYANDLLKCWSTPFASARCSRKDGVGTWWACEQNRVFASTTFPSCPLQCDEKFGPFRDSNADWLQNHHKIVDDEDWFKMPDRVEKGKDGNLVKIEGKWIK